MPWRKRFTICSLVMLVGKAGGLDGIALPMFDGLKLDQEKKCFLHLCMYLRSYIPRNITHFGIGWRYVSSISLGVLDLMFRTLHILRPTDLKNHLYESIPQLCSLATCSTCHFSNHAILGYSFCENFSVVAFGKCNSSQNK